MSAAHIPVAVCVPAHGSAFGLRTLLESLQRVDYPKDLLQIIVAIDGPDPALESVARGYATDVIVSPHNRGSYAMRNLAVDAVRDAHVVLFTDSDCTVVPGWVKAHVRGLRDADLSGGPVRFTMGERPTPAEWMDSRQNLRQEHFITRLGYAATCNLGVRRSVLETVRFDSTLRSGGDFDFGQRAADAGFTLRHTSDAVIEHPARATARAVLKKIWRVSGGARDLAQRGRSATERRDPTRGRAAAAARSSSLDVSWLWLARVALLDYTCSIVYAVRVPQVIGPAVRRLLPRRA